MTSGDLPYLFVTVRSYLRFQRTVKIVSIILMPFKQAIERRDTTNRKHWHVSYQTETNNRKQILLYLLLRTYLVSSTRAYVSRNM